MDLVHFEILKLKNLKTNLTSEVYNIIKRLSNDS